MHCSATKLAVFNFKNNSNSMLNKLLNFVFCKKTHCFKYFSLHSKFKINLLRQTIFQVTETKLILSGLLNYQFPASINQLNQYELSTFHFLLGNYINM